MKNTFLFSIVLAAIVMSVPVTVGAVTITAADPLAFNNVEGVLGQVLDTLRSIIVILSLVFIVLGALFYITSAGDEGRVKFAKGAITASVVGLAIGIAAPSFLKEVGGIVGWGGAATGSVSSALTIAEIARNALDFLLSIFGTLAIIMLVVGGTMYLSSAGDEGRIDTAKNIVKWAIVGIGVAFAALVIVDQIASLLIAA